MKKHHNCFVLLVSLAACAPAKTPRAPIETVPMESEAEKKHVVQVTVEAPLMGPSDSPAAAAAPDAAGAGGKDSISKAECTKLTDHGIDVVLKGEPDLAAATPEMIKQMKEMARKQAGADPCDGKPIPRSQYTCGMKAKTKASFEACLK
jgi:hypothetical protein